MYTSSKELLESLIELTRSNLSTAQAFKQESPDLLNYKQSDKSWSVLECIEHLNLYGNFYIPEITERIKHAKSTNSEHFKSNWLGKCFSKSVSYKENLNKMKTFKSMNPLGSNLDVKTLDTFIQQQQQIIELLDVSRTVDLDKTKTAISISKLVKIKLGDTFRVLIYHNERHIEQAKRTLKMGSIQS